ncbi:hypothetical protein DEI81_08015 [Curtobacterium sp. MCBD17_013]|nr:hypothetical protein DEI81_08015 [Curtobacterium sp. MCBD17_013]
MFGIGCGGIVALAIILTVIGSFSHSSDDSVSDNSFEAKSACENQVKDHLKSPSTAKFNDSVSGVGPFTVTGTVDSENSFGAMLRSNFECSVRVTETQTFTTVKYLG